MYYNETTFLDEQFKDLKFATGAKERIDYAIHISLGMGSHIAIVVYKLSRSA